MKNYTEVVNKLLTLLFVGGVINIVAFAIVFVLALVFILKVWRDLMRKGLNEKRI